MLPSSLRKGILLSRSSGCRIERKEVNCDTTTTFSPGHHRRIRATSASAALAFELELRTAMSRALSRASTRLSAQLGTVSTMSARATAAPHSGHSCAASSAMSRQSRQKRWPYAVMTGSRGSARQ